MNERRCGPLAAAACGFVLGLIVAKLLAECRAGRGCCGHGGWCCGDGCCRDAGGDEDSFCCCESTADTAAGEEADAPAE